LTPDESCLKLGEVLKLAGKLTTGRVKVIEVSVERGKNLLLISYAMLAVLVTQRPKSIVK